MLNPKFIESSLNNSEQSLYLMIAQSVNNIVSLNLRNKKLEDMKNTRFLFSAVLRPFLLTTWNAGFNMGNTHAAAELRSANFSSCDYNTANFAEDDSLIEQEKLMNDLRKSRLESLNEEIKSLGFNSLNEAESFAKRYDSSRRNKAIEIMTSRGIDPNNMETVNDLLTEARGLSLDIKDREDYIKQVTKAAKKTKKTITTNDVAETITKDTSDTIDNITSTTSSTKLSPAQRLLRRANSRKGFIERAISQNAVDAANPKKGDAATIRDVKLRQEQVSNEIMRQTQIDLTSTDYANAYLNSRTEMLSSRLNDELNALYKRKISDYLSAVQNKGQRSLNPEQALIDDLTGKSSNKKVTQRINELLKANNVPSIRNRGKDGANVNEDLFEETQNEIENYNDQINFLKEELGYDSSDDINTVRDDLTDGIARLRSKQTLTINERTQMNNQIDKLRELNRFTNSLSEAQNLLTNLRQNPTLSGRDTNTIIRLSESDKALLGTTKNEMTVAELDAIRSQAIRNGRIPATNSILRTIRTELNTAYNMGRMNRFRVEKELSGNDVCVEWRNDIESNVCRYCASRAGTVISIDDVLTQGRIKYSNEYFIPAHPNCFIPGSKVRLGNGIEKNIEDISIGDIVVTGTSTNGMSPVYATMKSKYKGNIIRFTLENGRTIESTEDHSYFDGMGWRRAKDFGKNESFYSYTLDLTSTNKRSKQNNIISPHRLSLIRDRQIINSRDNESYQYKKYKINTSNIRLFKHRTKTEGLCLDRSETSKCFEENEREQSNVQSRNSTQNAINIIKERRSNNIQINYRIRTLQRWQKKRFKQPIFSIFLGSQFCKNSELFKTTLDIRTGSVRTVKWKILSSRLLSTESEFIYRNKRLLDGRCETEISIISPGVFAYKDPGIRSEEIQNLDFSLSELSPIRITNIETYYYEGYVYNLSVKEDECYTVSDVIVKNCRCYWTPVSCANKQKKAAYGTIAKWAAGTTVGVLGIVGAYLALNSLSRRNRGGQSLADAIKQRVTKQKPINEPIKEVIEQAIQDSRITRPIKDEVVKEAKQEFLKKVKEQLPIVEPIREIRKENTQLLRATFESLNNINSLSQTARDTFNRIVEDMNSAQTPEQFAAVRDRANRFMKQINDEIETAKLNRSRASANLANTTGSLSDLRGQITQSIIENEDFANTYNNYRRLESPIVDIVDSIDDVQSLNNQGIQINNFIDQYDSNILDNIDNLTNITDSLRDIVLSSNAQLPEEQADNFIRRRLDEINTNIKIIGSKQGNKTAKDLMDEVIANRAKIAQYQRQLDSISALRKIADSSIPNYDFYKKEIRRILNEIAQLKSKFPEDPRSMSNEMAQLFSYIGDPTSPYVKKLAAKRNNQLRNAANVYNQLEELENELNIFIDNVETKPKLRTVDRIRNLGINLTREEYIASIADEISQLKAIRKDRRTPQQNARLQELEVEQVRVLRAEFKRPKLYNVAEFSYTKEERNKLLLRYGQSLPKK